MNSRISVLEVRLIASNGDQVGVLDTAKALELAKEEELDLVEIVPNQTPPVCRIMDYGKFRFDNQKKAHAAKKKQKQTQVKEIKFIFTVFQIFRSFVLNSSHQHFHTQFQSFFFYCL